MMRRNRSTIRQRQHRFRTIETLEPRRLLAAGWQNPTNPLNVDDSPDRQVVSLDALLIINELNSPTVRDIATGALPDVDSIPNKPPPYFDVSGDNFVSPFDALLVINVLNFDKEGPEINAAFDESTATVRGTVDDLWAGVASLEASIDGKESTPVAFDIQDGSFNLDVAALVNSGGRHNVRLTALDAVRNSSVPIDISLGSNTESFRLSELSPINGEEMVNVTREAIVRFTEEIDPSTITEESIKVIANGLAVAGRRVVSSTNRFVTFFPDESWPSSTEIRVRIDGDQILAANGDKLDADNNGQPGGIKTVDFRTLPLTRITGTNVFGFIYDSFNTDNMGNNIPIVGATIRVDAFPEANVVTDENGRFELVDMPAPQFFVHVDGSTATNAPDGFMYPNVGKPFGSIPGQTVQLTIAGDPFDLFLPPIALADIQDLSDTETTDVGFGDEGLLALAELFPDVDPAMFAAMSVSIAPGSAQDSQGNAATRATIVPVPADRIPGVLPPNLETSLVVSIQTFGATNFDVPAPVTFPNVDGLAPGSKATLFSFDHDRGEFATIGLGTVSDDGLSIASDPGVGILAPGWHLASPPLNWGGTFGPPEGNEPADEDVEEEEEEEDPEVIVRVFASGDTTELELTFESPAGPGTRVGEHAPPDDAGQSILLVEIVVEGDFYDEFYDASGREGLQSDRFAMLPGDEAITRTATLRTLDDIQNLGNGGTPFDKDVIYGAKITVIETLTLADGTETSNTRIILPYLYLDQADDSGEDQILRIRDTAFVGDIASEREYEMRVDGAPVPFFEFDGAPQFIDTLTALKFDPDRAGVFAADMKVLVFIDGEEYRSDNSVPITATATTGTTVYFNQVGALASMAAIGTPPADAQMIYDGMKAQFIAEFANKIGGKAASIFRINDGAMGPAGQRNIEVLWTFYNNEWFDTNNDGNIQKMELFDSDGDGTRGNTPGDYVDLNGNSMPDAGEFFGPMVRDVTGDGMITAGDYVDLNGNGRVDRNNLLGRAFTGVDFNTSKFGVELVTNRSQYGIAQQAFIFDSLFDAAALGQFELGIDNIIAARNIAAAGAYGGIVVAHEAFHTLGMVHSDNMGIGQADIQNHTVPPANNLTGASTFAMRAALDAEITDAGINIARSAYRVGYNLRRSPPSAFPSLYSEPVEERGPQFALLVNDADLTPLFDDVAFGPIVSDGTGSALVTINAVVQNPGDESLIISSFDFADNTKGFAVGGLTANESIASFTSIPITLTFDPTMIGELSDMLVLETNVTGPSDPDPDLFPSSGDGDPADTGPADVGEPFDGVFNIAFTGRGLDSNPVFDFALGRLGNNNFGGVSVEDATTKDEFITITNQGNGDLVFTPAVTSGEADFDIGAINGVQQTLAFGESLIIPTTFNPSTLGLRPGTIQFATNDSNHAMVEQGVVGTGIPQGGIRQDDFYWGNDFVSISNEAFVQRETSNTAGDFTFALPVDAPYEISIFDPASGYIATSGGTTGPAGAFSDLSRKLEFKASIAPDLDFDGLPDDIEFAIGTSLNLADTDMDGASDFAEIENNLNPLDGVAYPTGIIASLPLLGSAEQVVVEADGTGLTAYVATDDHGLALVDVAQFNNPIVLGQLNLPGTNTDVSVDVARQLAAVAGGSVGLHLVDISDPMLPVLLQTLPVLGGADHVEVFDGLAYVVSGNVLRTIDLDTNQTLQTLVLSLRGRVTGMARDGKTLYTFSNNPDVLRVIDISNDNAAIVSGTLNMNIAANEVGVFAGNGIVYLGASGMTTVDATDPENPTLISAADVQFTASAAVANGSGIALVASQDQGVGVYDVTDLSETANSLALFDTPGSAINVAIAQGIAFVADDFGDFHVVNYLSFDSLGQAPVVSVTAIAEDLDPMTPGVQIFEGTALPITVNVTDDVQVSRVELLVDGQVVATDVSFPFEFAPIAPIVSMVPASTIVQVRATDTGFNTSLSAPLTFDIVEDTFEPVLQETSPADGADVFFTPSIDLRYNEALDVDLLLLSGITLTNLGIDGQLGGGDDIVLPLESVTLRNSGRRVSILPEQVMGTGSYYLSVDSSILVDLAGNAAPAIDIDFTIRAASDLHAEFGFPTAAQAPSANEGQTFGLDIPWDPAASYITFPTRDRQGLAGTRDVTPDSVDTETGKGFFVVPRDPETGDITVVGIGGRNFSYLPNWNVTGGSVDVFGMSSQGDVFGDYLPDNGLYVNLDGFSGIGGTLESKQIFNLAPGEYELTFDLAGAELAGVNNVTVSLGALFNEQFTKEMGDAFETITRTINVPAATQAQLIFAHDGNDSSGLALDNVALTNTDTAEVLLRDDFSLTFPGGPFLMQIVPTVNALLPGAPYHGSSLQIRGSGFIEGAITINFGPDAVEDPDITTAIIDVTASTSVFVVVPEGAAIGPISVTTAGGTSATFGVTVDSITAVAASGTPANENELSANAGQAIVFHGSGFDILDRVFLDRADDRGNIFGRTIVPAFVSDDGTEMTVIVPIDAVTGNIGIIGDLNNMYVPLQIVPVVTQIDFRSVAADGSTAVVRLRGSGFIEGHNTTYTIGDTAIVDTSVGVGINSFSSNTGAEFTVNHTDGIYGDVTVTTAGGTSAIYAVTVTELDATAARGTSTDPMLPSANPGQLVSLVGPVFSTATDIIIRSTDDSGATITEIINPTYVSIDRTRADLQIPANLNGAMTLRVAGSTFAPTLQIVPTLTGVDFRGLNSAVRITGSGFVENAATYTFDGVNAVDPDTAVDVQTNGTLSDLTSPIHGFGSVTVTTLGGTSDPLATNFANPGLGALHDIALDPNTGNLIVANGTQFHIINPDTGATISSFDLPSESSSIGLQVTADALTLNGVAVPVGSLLITDGDASTDKIIAVSLADGSTLATLDLGQDLDPVAGVFDPISGSIFILTATDNEVIEIDPADGSEGNSFVIPIDVGRGGITIDPATGNLLIGSDQSNHAVEMQTDGTFVRFIELAPQGINLEITGLDFNAAGDLLVSSLRGAIYAMELDQTYDVPQTMTLVSINTMAEVGTPTDNMIASANIGQLIELIGTNLDAGNFLVQFPTRSETGVVGSTSVVPISVSADGTRAIALLPDDATTGDISITPLGLGLNLGFASAADAIYRGVTVTFTPAASAAQITFADVGLQGITDESWGIDNVDVALTSAPGVSLFNDDFEGGANAAWSDSTTDATNGIFTEFSGRFNGTQDLNLTGLTPGQSHTLTVDLYIIDSWDGTSTTNGPDILEIRVDNQTRFSEAFGGGQTFEVADSGSVPLQIVPRITGTSGRPGVGDSFVILGSGFMEGDSVITVGGLEFVDQYTNLSDLNVTGTSNSSYRLAAPFALDGLIKVTTPGGSFQFDRQPSGSQPGVEFDGFEVVSNFAEPLLGIPADPNVQSANTGQIINLSGRGFSNNTLVQFTAVDDNGVVGVVTRQGVSLNIGTGLQLVVPAMAVTGSITVLGSNNVLPLQIIPALRASGGEVAPGNTIMLEGSGLSDGSLIITIDGQTVLDPQLVTLAERTRADGFMSQQLVTLTVPQGVDAGRITVTTVGGTYLLRVDEARTALPAIATPSDIADTIATATFVELPTYGTVNIESTIGDHTRGLSDVDMYAFDLTRGDKIIFDVDAKDRIPPTSLRSRLSVFDAEGTLVAGSGSLINDPFTLFSAVDSGTYYLAVSDVRATFDPNVSGSAIPGNIITAGDYLLKVERVDGRATTIDSISAVAESGTPTHSTIPSANLEQTIILHGSGFLSTDRVVFTAGDIAGGRRTHQVNTLVDVAEDGSTITVVVPLNAARIVTTGVVRLQREATGKILQIVPTISDVDQGVDDTFHAGGLRILATGLVEGGMTVNFGGDAVVDPAISTSVINMAAAIVLNMKVPNGVATGPISITTVGGTSEVFDLTFDSITAAADSGTPADAGEASANPGQAITLNGTGFDLTTDVLFYVANGSGVISERIVRPAEVNEAGTTITLTVPADAITSNIGIVGDSNGSMRLLQIVPA